jgi:hypothetical protein
MSLFRIDKVVLIILLIDSILVRENNEVIILVLIPLLFFSSRRYNLNSSYFFKIGITFLILVSVLDFAAYVIPAKKLASWAFIYMTVGIVEFGFKDLSKKLKSFHF